jgi:hypothetical protein
LKREDLNEGERIIMIYEEAKPGDNSNFIGATIDFRP